MRHTRIIVDHQGSPETPYVVEEECPNPKAGEVRVKVLSAGVGMPDIMVRKGIHPEIQQVGICMGPRSIR